MAKAKPVVEAIEAQVEAPEEVTKAPRAAADVIHWAYDNEHELGCFCTLTFSDGTESTGTAPRTDNLAADQAIASAAALQG